MIACFVTEILPVDTTSLLVMTFLMVTGLVTPLEGISGFANEATITILALFVIGAGLDNTGAIDYLGKKIQKYFLNQEWVVITFIIILVGGLSAFINNTAIVLVFLPILLRISRISNISPNRLLITLSFAAMMGGSTTIIGTSTNLIVSSMAASSGYEGFKFFLNLNFIALFAFVADYQISHIYY